VVEPPPAATGANGVSVRGADDGDDTMDVGV
jgi:hypothetical protein